MAEGPPDQSPTASPAADAPAGEEPDEQLTPAASREGRIDPLSVAASGLVDVSDLPEDRPGLRGRIGRRRDRDAAPEAAGSSPATPGDEPAGTTEPSDPLAVLAAALDAGEQTPPEAPTEPEPARARHLRRRTPRHADEPTTPAERPAGILPDSLPPAPVDPRVPSSGDVAQAAAELDLPPALVELAAESADGVPIGPRRRGTFRRRGAEVGNEPGADDATLFEVPAESSPDDSPTAPVTAAAAETAPEDVVADSETDTGTAGQAAEQDVPRVAKHVATVADDTPAWQALHEPQPYVAAEPAGPAGVAGDPPAADEGETSARSHPAAGDGPVSTEAEVERFPEPVASDPFDVAVTGSSDEVTDEWSDDDLQATQWASQWSPAVPPDPVAAPMATPAAEVSQPAVPVQEQDPEEEHSVSWEQSETSEEVQPQPAPGVGTSAERPRRGLRARRRGGRGEAGAPAADTSTPDVAASAADSGAAAADLNTPLDLLSGYTSAASPVAGSGEEPASTAAAVDAEATPGEEEAYAPAAVEPAAAGDAVGRELWDEPDTDGGTEETTEQSSHEGWLSRRRGGSRRRADVRPADDETEPQPVSGSTSEAVEEGGTPDGDAADVSDATDATGATDVTVDAAADGAGQDTAVDASDYPWSAADLAGQGWTREDLLGAGWNDEQLVAVGWTAEFEATLAGTPYDAPSEPDVSEPAAAEEADAEDVDAQGPATASEAPDGTEEEVGAASGDDAFSDPVEVLSADSTVGTPDADAAAQPLGSSPDVSEEAAGDAVEPDTAEAAPQLAASTDDPVEELVTAEEPADTPADTTPDTAGADPQTASTTKDPVEELATSEEADTTPADTAPGDNTEADPQLASTTKDPVEELVTADEPADTTPADIAPTETTEPDQQLASTTEDPVEEVLDTPAPADVVAEEAVVPAPIEHPAPAPAVTPAPRAGDFDLFYDDDLGVEPEDFDIEAPLAQRARSAARDDLLLDEPLPEEPGVPAPAPSEPTAPPAEDSSEAPESDPADAVAASPDRESEPGETTVEGPESDEIPTGTLAASIGAPIAVEEATPASPGQEPDAEDGAEPAAVVERPGATAAEGPQSDETEHGNENVADRSDPFSAGSWSSNEVEDQSAAPEEDEPAAVPEADTGDEPGDVDTGDEPGDVDTGDEPGEEPADDRAEDTDEGTDDDGDQGWPGGGPDADDDTPLSPSGAAAEEPPTGTPDPEPMTYAWALAELAGQADTGEEPGAAPTVGSLSEPAGSEELTGLVDTDEDATSAPDVAREQQGAADAAADGAAEGPAGGVEVPPAPPPEEAGAGTGGTAGESSSAEDASDPAAPTDAPETADTDTSWTSSWSPTWEPTGSSAPAEQTSAASPVATESLLDNAATTPATPADPFAPVPVVPTVADEAIPSPDDTAAAAEKLTQTPDGDEIPPFVEYRPSDLRRYVLGLLFVATSLLAVIAIFYAVQQGGTAPAITAAAVTVLAGAFWWGLLSWAPKIVSISRGILEVAQGPTSERFDLRDPATEVVVGDNPRSHAWTTTVARPNGSKLVIKSSQVRPQQFSTIVQHYRSLAAADS